MAAVFKYEEKDVPQFQEDVCKKTCILKGKCIGEEDKGNHWFLMCPHYHRWKLGYTNFVFEQLQWQIDHPEDVKEKAEKNKNIAKRLRDEKKKAKTSQSD